MSEAAKGILAMGAACVVWGLSPLFYALLEHVSPGEVLAHRTLWSLVLFGAVLSVQGRLGAVPAALSSWRASGIVLFASLMIAINWFIFISAVQIGKVTEASLGYYIFPLAAVLFGVVFFSERLGRVQIMAVALATLAVITLTVGLKAAPWIALTLAVTFGLYGVIKKGLAAGPVVSVTAEVLVLAPIAAAWLWWNYTPDVAWLVPRTQALLALSGPMTAIPLILFSYATRRVRMATVGLIQYLNPTLQFLCAVVVFAEPLSGWHVAAFAMIWTALALYSVSSLRERERR